jgi:type VI secretion system protein ImpL
MKSLLLKILKIFLIFALVALVILLVLGLVFTLGWPWWVGLFILVGLLGLWIGFLFLRKLWLRRKEQRFVEQIVEQDEARLKDLSEQDKQQGKELQNRWKEAIDALRSSHLKRLGNPLYVLPWYLLIGESGSGKTTAIRSARLSSPFADLRQASGISGTKNCDWWFFEQAVLIDTAGRYAIPVDEGRDKDEWQRFLGLLAKYRKKEPLNGLIVTIAADKCVKEPVEVLEQDGKSIRRRVDELMRVLGAKFPVYLMVTKCDLIQGMTQFSDQLPETSLSQAMGAINPTLSKDVAAFLERVLPAMGERLRDLRLLLLYESRSKHVDPGMVLFPQEFENLKPGLGAFIRGAFQENPYQETPLLRGLFFSSGRQEGMPYSHLLKALGLLDAKDVLPGTDKGLFLHDFFGKILPKDRYLFAPTQRAVQWSQITRNLGLTAWVVLGIAICGLLSFSFVKNLATINTFSHEFPRPIVLSQEVLPDLTIMERFQKTLFKVEELNRHWWIPRFGLTESNRVEIELKRKYCSQFQQGILAPLDRDMAAQMTGFSATTPGRSIGEYALHLARRINLLKARLQGDSAEGLQKKLQPPYGPTLAAADKEVITDANGKFSRCNVHYLGWNPDPGQLNQEMTQLQIWLQRMVSLPGLDLRWLVDWENGEDGAVAVALEQFWSGSLPLAKESSVAPAFTRKGKEHIDAFLAEIDAALADTATIAERKKDFAQWYRKQYLTSWQEFAGFFPKGVEKLKGRPEWQPMAAKMASDQCPYFALLDRMAGELFPWVGGERLPSWAELALEWKSMKMLEGKAASPAAGILDKAVDKAGQELKRATGKAGEVAGKAVGEAVGAQTRTAKIYAEYHDALAEITPVSTSRKLAYEMATKIYSEDAATGKSPFFTADTTVSRLRTSMAASGGSSDDVFWKLVTGPRDFLLQYVRNETACQLQSDWEAKVLVEMKGLSGWDNISSVLLAQGGFVWKYVENGPVTPFISRSLKGYSAKEAFGGAIALDTNFLSFLDRSDVERKKIGERQRALAAAAAAAAAAPPAGGGGPPPKENYPVLIKGVPTGTNPEAQKKPQATRLELHCTDAVQTLVNYNYPIEKTFNWAPESCSDVTLQIEVPGVVVSKRYSGPTAFQAFLRDFRRGERSFYSREFPSQQTALEQLGIKYIKVQYEFNGAGAALQHGAGGKGKAPTTPTPPALQPIPIPTRIVTCWDQ